MWHEFLVIEVIRNKISEIFMAEWNLGIFPAIEMKLDAGINAVSSIYDPQVSRSCQ